MILLAIDTSSREGSAALSVDGEITGPVRFGTEDSHLVAIGTSMNALLRKHRLGIRDLGRMALVSGPGSFTGLRIGMAFVKGIHAALGTEVVTITSLELLARPLLKDDRTVCPMVDARKSEVYAALYRPERIEKGETARAFLPPRVVSPEAFARDLRAIEEGPVRFVGSGAEKYRKGIASALGGDALFASGDANRPSMRLLAEIAEDLPPLGHEDILTLEPYYIRSSDAELKRLKAHRTHEKH